MIVTATNAIPVGTEVAAEWFDGTPLRGRIVGRSWWFDRLDFYVVETPEEVRPRTAGQPARTRWHVYPHRDPIRPA